MSPNVLLPETVLGTGERLDGRLPDGWSNERSGGIGLIASGKIFSLLL